ncbi:MAG TPA: CopD family protein [Terriglobia bacterium]|nr:CopD family protein [Terriglobia bacterium]
MSDVFNWTLVFHVLGIVFWLGGLLVVTHLLAADTEAVSDETRQTLGRLEAKLFNGIIHPGAAIVILSGLVLLMTNPRYYFDASWLRVKLIMVAALIVMDWITFRRMLAFKAGRIKLERKQCMALHGGIALAFIVILILVLIQPF